MRFVVMGVAGAGKSVVGAALARALGVEFVEGDAFHSHANREKMASGAPLTDDDRAEWLRDLAERLGDAAIRGAGVVVSCSALKRVYRDVLRTGDDRVTPPVRFVYLRGEESLLAQRLTARTGHFMPPSLLASQLATLEEPTRAEDAWTFSVTESPDAIVAAIVARTHGASV